MCALDCIEFNLKEANVGGTKRKKGRKGRIETIVFRNFAYLFGDTK